MMSYYIENEAIAAALNTSSPLQGLFEDDNLQENSSQQNEDLSSDQEEYSSAQPLATQINTAKPDIESKVDHNSNKPSL